tara:strand:- start:270 stop:2009 length:1740 start_codon:yes stop_codon:yes gene_type:complete
MTKNKDLNYLKKLLAKEKRKEQEKVDIIGSLENRINHAELTVDSILGLENSKQRQINTIKGLQSKYELSINNPKKFEQQYKKITEKSLDREGKEWQMIKQLHGVIKYTYEYSDHCLMRHNKGNLRYGYVRFFDPDLVHELATSEDEEIEINSLRTQKFIDAFNRISYDIPNCYEADWFKIESPFGYEPWQNILSWLTNLYFACPTQNQNLKLVKETYRFDYQSFECRSIDWNIDSLKVLDIPFIKDLCKWSYGLEHRVIAHTLTKDCVEPVYLTKRFCIQKFYQDIPPLINVGEKETDSCFIMMLPKKICQYIIAGVDEEEIIENKLTKKYKKLLPKREDEDYCPDQVAILVITNKRWRRLVKEECEKFVDIKPNNKGFGYKSRYETISKEAIQNIDHPDACMFKPGFKMVTLTDEAIYCFADYNWETGTKNIRSVSKTVRQHCNWNGNEIDQEFIDDDFQEGHMLFNGLINIAANTIIQMNREKEIIEVESSGLNRTAKEEKTESKEYKKPIKWIGIDPEVKKKYIYPEDHVPEKGSPKCEHIRSGHWRNVWVGKGKDKQKTKVWVNEMYIKGNKEEN